MDKNILNNKNTKCNTSGYLYAYTSSFCQLLITGQTSNCYSFHVKDAGLCDVDDVVCVCVCVCAECLMSEWGQCEAQNMVVLAATRPPRIGSRWVCICECVCVFTLDVHVSSKEKPLKIK